MEDIFSRTELLIGADALEKLNNSHVALFGVGGVGGYALEALVRAGVGTLSLFDFDVVSVSNLNRQIIATTETIGEKKVLAAKKRAELINPKVVIHPFDMRVGKDNLSEIDFSQFDYIIDAVDNVTAKIALAVLAEEKKLPIISAMGAGNKLDPTKFIICDIYSTSVCPLARVMRTELKKRGVKALKVCYSTETAIKREPEISGERPVVASISFVPSVCGLFIASEVIRDLIRL